MKPGEFKRAVLAAIRDGKARAVPNGLLPDKWMPWVIQGLIAGQVFALPIGGRVLDDPLYRGIAGLAELALPYETVVLEWEADEGKLRLQDCPDYAEKTALIVTQGARFFTFSSCYYSNTGKVWVIGPPVGIPRVGAVGGVDPATGRSSVAIYADNGSGLRRSEYLDEAIAILSLCNILSCSNVQSERIEPSRLKQQMARDKNALPFDAYHILTIENTGVKRGLPGTGGGHGSPREHLRRGHIRRLEDGRRVWVNAAVINAAVGGKVHKDYRVR